jgi:hypothetical protein
VNDGPDDDSLAAAVSEVLFARWDPIDAKAMDPAWPRDEYAGYSASVLALLRASASDDVVAELLARIEDHWMGLTPSPLASRLEVAAQLRALMRSFRERHG